MNTKRAEGNLKAHSVSKILGVTIGSNLKFSQHCKDAASRANRMLGFMNRFFLKKKKKKKKSASIYQLGVYCAILQLWSPHLAKDSKI